MAPSSKFDKLIADLQAFSENVEISIPKSGLLSQILKEEIIETPMDQVSLRLNKVVAKNLFEP